MPAIAPSILAADFSRLGELVHAVKLGGADRVHVDVMDGHFVPNLSMGPIVVQGLAHCGLPLEVHLMVAEPMRYVEPFLKAGAASIIVHLEVLPDPRPFIREMRSRNKGVGLVINPGTPVEIFEPFLPLIDLALLMTVWPGFGGQAFLPDSPDRIRRLRAMVDSLHPACEIEVDGGIDLISAPFAARAGANVFVAGTSVFGSPAGPEAAVRQLLEASSVPLPQA